MCLCLESRRVGCKGMEELERLAVVDVVVGVMVIGGMWSIVQGSDLDHASRVLSLLLCP